MNRSRETEGTGFRELDVHCGRGSRQQKRKKCGKPQVPVSVDGATVVLEAAAVKIQNRFRMRRARREFVNMVKRAYERVYDPASKQYFYYNNRSRQSHWEAPALLKEVQTEDNRYRRLRTQNRESSPTLLSAAATRIQSLYRRRAARSALKHLLMQVYERVYDDESKSYYFYNKRTKTSSWDPPKPLGGVLSTNPLDAPAAKDDPKRVMAATKIQKLYRRRVTQLFVRDLARGNIERHYDSAAHAWFYYNLRTQERFWEEPRHTQITAGLAR